MSLEERMGRKIVDPHHHFYCSRTNKDLHSIIKPLLLGEEEEEREICYLPEDYERDSSSLQILKSVHVECLPTCGIKEIEWVNSLIQQKRATKVKGIVASCDPTSPTMSQSLSLLSSSSSLLKGIRWILNFDGHIGEGEKPIETKATWPNVKDNFLITETKQFHQLEKGFSLLEERKLSFDLQCNPSQLFGAFFLCQKYPNVPVVLDHLGHPRHLTGDPKIDEPTLTIWRKGMNKLASLPHIHVKLSMLGYSIPNWNKDPKKEEYAKKIVLEVIDLFGVERCMFASNWPVDKGDGWSSLGELYQKYLGWVDHFSEEEKDYLFWRTANQFYRLEE